MTKFSPGLLAAVVLCAVAGLGLATLARAGFDAGIEYRELSQPARAEPGDDVEVLEVFWYACPHCYHLEPALNAWRARLPAGVTFRRMPAAAASHWRPHARAYYAAEQIGALDQLHEPLFKALHEAHRRIMTDQELITFAAEAGIDEAAFRAAFESFEVDTKVRRAAEFARSHEITGVPTLLINGKYLTSVTLTGTAEAMFAVADELIAKEQAALAAAPAAPPPDSDAPTAPPAATQAPPATPAPAGS